MKVKNPGKQVSKARINPKSPTSRKNQEREDSGACVEGRELSGQLRMEVLSERETMTPIVAFDHGFMNQENGNTLPILICRDRKYGQTGASCCERKGPTAYFISFLVGFIKDLGLRKIFSKSDNEPNTNSLHDAVIQDIACVEVIPEGLPEGDHVANGRVEMAVREVKKKVQNTSDLS